MDELAAWSEFCVATAGATAALAGLAIVALSVNIERVLAAPTVPARAASALGALVVAMAAACAALMPGQSLRALGVEILIAVALLGAVHTQALRKVVADAATSVAVRMAQSVAGSLAPLAYLVGAVVLIAGSSIGFAIVAAGIVVSLAAGVLVAWVALVEVLR